jgi:hypothetical protein
MVTEEIYQLNSLLVEGVLPDKQDDVKSSGSKTESPNKKQ